MDYFGDGSGNSPVTGEPFGVHIDYYFEEEPLGNAGALFKIKDKLTSDFLLLNADAMFDVDFNRFVAFHRKHGGLVTLFTHPNSHPYDSGLIIANKNGVVEKWLTKEDERPTYYKNRVNAGLHVINPKVLELVGINADSVGKVGVDGKPVKVDLDRQLLKPLAGTGKMFCYDSPEYVKDMAMSVVSILVGVIAVVTASYKVEARVFSDVGIKAIFSGIVFVLIFITGKCFCSKEYWKYSIAFNLPLIPHYLSNYILNQSDRVMIGRMVGNSQAAYYSVAYTISTVMVLITNAINSSLTPYIYKSIASDEKGKIKKATRPLVILVAGLCVVTMAFAPEVIRVFAGKKYMDAIYVIPPVAASVFFIFLYSLFSTIEYYYQKTGFIAIATCVCAVLNLVLNYFGIKMYGYYAAGYTTLICYVCLAFFHYIFYKKALKEVGNEENMYDVKLIVSLSAIVIAIMIIMALTYSQTWIRYGLLIAIVCVSIIFKNKILEAISALRK